jgi:hypothetical protein
MDRGPPKQKGRDKRGLLDTDQAASDALDLFQHLENRFRRTDEHAFEGLGQATALKGVTTGAFAFSHVFFSGKPTL